MNENPPRGLHWLLPSVGVWVFILVFWMSLIFMPQMLNGDGDLGRHITLGTYIVETAHIPTMDLFSHTRPGAFMVPHEWMSQLFFALAHRAAGLNGIAWLTAVIIATTYTLTTITLQRSDVSAFIALTGGLFASAVGAIHMLTRPHLFTLLFFAMALFILETYRRCHKPRVLLWLLPLMILWANTHGAFISGLVLVLLYALGAVLEKQKRPSRVLFTTLVLLMAVSLLNPVGTALLQNSFSYLQEDFLVDLTNEYRSPNFHTYSTWPFAALLLGSLALGWWAGYRLSRTAVIMLVTWTAFALYSARNIPLYGLVAVVLLAPKADAWLHEAWPRLGHFLTGTDAIARRSWGWMWAVVATAALIGWQASGAKLDVFQMGNTIDPHRFPVAAIDAVAADLPPGAMFNEFHWGGYLLYRLWPEKTVFIDAQTDFYGETLTREFISIANAESGWEEKLEQYDVQWIIIPPATPLAAWLAQAAAWEQIYGDDTAVIWARR